jgi:hypothetical protein
VATQISVKTGEKFVVRDGPRGPERFRVPTVEVWIGGKCFVHLCESDEEARQMVFTTAIDLGM